MDRIVRYTEQLQLAGGYLHEKSHQLARLSLILCDNVVELLAHERCQEHVRKELPPWIDSPKLSANDRRDAREQKFAPKLNLLMRLGDVQSEERDFANNAHHLRNECYHTAALHEQIARTVAWEYHELACTLFDRWRQCGYSVGGTIHQSEATRQIIESAGLGHRFHGKLEDGLIKLSVLLRATKPKAIEPLGAALSKAATRRFNELIHSIEFIAQDGLRDGERYDREMAIKDAYFRATLDVDSLKRDIDTQSHDGFVEVHRRYDAARAAYVAPVCFARVEGWHGRAVALANERNSSKVLVKYMDLLRESEDTFTFLDEASMQLDLAIQHQIDVARGN